jgi:hypothetical protein
MEAKALERSCPDLHHHRVGLIGERGIDVPHLLAHPQHRLIEGESGSENGRFPVEGFPPRSLSEIDYAVFGGISARTFSSTNVSAFAILGL